MDNYDTKPMDFTGCDPVIEQALKNNLMIKCRTEEIVGRYIVMYDAEDGTYRSDEGVWFNYARPIPKVRRRVMPAAKAIDTLLKHGYAFDSVGNLVSDDGLLPTTMFRHFGKYVEEVNFVLPAIIIEEVE